MSASLALYHAVKRFPGNAKLGVGIQAIARLLGKSEDVLQKKLNPACETHHITLDEAEEIVKLLGDDPSVAIAMANAVGLTCIPMPASDRAGSLYKGMADIGQEFSELMREFSDATRDNMISPNECDRFQKEAVDLCGALFTELRRMRAYADTRAPVVPIGPHEV